MSKQNVPVNVHVLSLHMYVHATCLTWRPGVSCDAVTARAMHTALLSLRWWSKTCSFPPQSSVLGPRQPASPGPRPPHLTARVAAGTCRRVGLLLPLSSPSGLASLALARVESRRVMGPEGMQGPVHSVHSPISTGRHCHSTHVFIILSKHALPSAHNRQRRAGVTAPGELGCAPCRGSSGFVSRCTCLRSSSVWHSWSFSTRLTSPLS